MRRAWRGTRGSSPIVRAWGASLCLHAGLLGGLAVLPSPPVARRVTASLRGPTRALTQGPTAVRLVWITPPTAAVSVARPAPRPRPLDAAPPPDRPVAPTADPSRGTSEDSVRADSVGMGRGAPPEDVTVPPERTADLALHILPPQFFPGPTPVSRALRAMAQALPPGQALVRALLDPAGHLVDGSLEVLAVSDPRWTPVLQAWWPLTRPGRPEPRSATRPPDDVAETPPTSSSTARWTVVQQQIWLRRP